MKSALCWISLEATEISQLSRDVQRRLFSSALGVREVGRKIHKTPNVR